MAATRLFRFLVDLSDRQDRPALGLVQDLGHGQVDRRQATDDSLEAGDLADRRRPGPVADREQYEEDGQAEEDELEGPVLAEGPEPHEEGEQAPQEQVPAHEGHGRRPAVRGAGPGDDPQGDERQPKQSVRREGRRPEGVPFLELHDAGDDLGDPTVEDAHGQDHGADREKTGVMDVEEDGGHPEAHQAEGRGVGEFVVVHWDLLPSII